MKFIKARRKYKCQECKGVIGKGDLYKRQTVKLGKPTWKKVIQETVEKVNGTPTVVAHVYTIVIKLCAFCTHRGIVYGSMGQVLDE